MSDHLLAEGPTDGVARLTLRNPSKKNALSIELRDALADALDAFAADEAVKVVTVTGTGDTFSAGFDLREFERAFGDEAFAARLWASSDRYHRTCIEFPLPLVAAVNGPAVAGGFDLAVMCDLRVASDTARFSHPELAFGDVVYGPLHDLVGGAVARDLCLTGRVIDATEALRVGVVNRVVPAAELPAAAAEVAAAIARAPRDVLLRTKAKVLARARLVVGGTLEL
ncbi:MAG: enoyl-CoA hydratase/isomerase family protein [Acidimicrobiia bacterium]